MKRGANDQEPKEPTTARGVAAEMRDHADGWHANGARTPGWVLRRWADFVEDQEKRICSLPPQGQQGQAMKIVVHRDEYRASGWIWSICGKPGGLHARSIWTYTTEESALRTVRRLFGKDVKVEVVR